MLEKTARELLEQNLGYEFKKPELIIEALTHKSYSHEQRSHGNNERLEFLGDTFINFCVSEHLMTAGPRLSEGQLSKLGAQIISEKNLAQTARRLGLAASVLLGKGEELMGGRSRDALLADSLEAVSAAIYFDAGFEGARNIILKMLRLRETTLTPKRAQVMIRRDHKSHLQELCQGLDLGTPVYRCLEITGPDHEKSFTMAIYLGDVEITRASAATKKLATQLAAETILKRHKTARALREYLRTKGVTAKKEPSSHESSLL